jgi:hypothetical protein
MMKQLEFHFDRLQTEHVCEQCSKKNARWVSAMTMYSWDGTGINPNRDLLFCDECEDEYCEFWQEMWNDYYSGRL